MTAIRIFSLLVDAQKIRYFENYYSEHSIIFNKVCIVNKSNNTPKKHSIKSLYFCRHVAGFRHAENLIHGSLSSETNWKIVIEILIWLNLNNSV